MENQLSPCCSLVSTVLHADAISLAMQIEEFGGLDEQPPVVLFRNKDGHKRLDVE